MIKSIWNSEIKSIFDSKSSYIGMIAGVLFMLVLFAFPAITIVAINYLFNTSIPINFFTFCATLWLMVILGGGSK